MVILGFVNIDSTELIMFTKMVPYPYDVMFDIKAYSRTSFGGGSFCTVNKLLH